MQTINKFSHQIAPIGARESFQMTMMPHVSSASASEAMMQAFAGQLEHELLDLLQLPDEQTFDPRWSRVLAELRAYAARPAKRVRPILLVAGWALTQGRAIGEVPQGVRQFAAALELLHAHSRRRR